MAWNSDLISIKKIDATFPEVATDYIDPALKMPLDLHLKFHWLVSRQNGGYSQGYEANKVKASLESGKFTEKDWLAIAQVCEFPRSWAYRMFEEYGMGVQVP